ncbi:MAG: FHA domain-containing protein [Saccharolobus sp.]
MTWKCPICGYDNSDDSLFCIKCGTKRTEQVIQQNQPSQSPIEPTPQAEQQSVTPQPSQVEQQQNQSSAEQPITPSQPVEQQVSTNPSVGQEANQITTQPVTQQVTVNYYLLFINTPNPAFNKTKLPLEFSIFPTISIGRSPENVIVIPDPEVSRKHALISLENGELYIEDLNSTNGTYIYDGKVFQPVKGKMKVQTNSIIKLGNNTVIRIVGE